MKIKSSKPTLNNKRFKKVQYVDKKTDAINVSEKAFVRIKKTRRNLRERTFNEFRNEFKNITKS